MGKILPKTEVLNVKTRFGNFYAQDKFQNKSQDKSQDKYLASKNQIVALPILSLRNLH
jgi:hypothetical protein